MPQSIFFEVNEIDISKHIGPGYIPMIEDLVRIYLIQVVVQFMLFIRSPSHYSIFDCDFLENLIYIGLGMCVYWLVFKRLVKLK
jgi:hypothetical protein